MNTSFNKWRDENSFVEDHILYDEGEDCRWCRFSTQWNEKKEDKNDIITHLCAFTLDLQTGDLYLDCRKRKIWAKFFVLSVTRPLFGFIKTAYHLCLPISIPIEIFKAIIVGRHQNQSSDEIAQAAWINIKYNIADIIRTPLYTTALIVVTISAVIIGPFAPRKLYDLRALAGHLEIVLNRGQDSLWNLAPCFQPLNNLMEIHKENYQKADTEYDDEATLQGCNNLVRSYIKFRREHRNIFNDCGMLLPENKVYISAAFPSMNCECN